MFAFYKFPVCYLFDQFCMLILLCSNAYKFTPNFKVEDIMESP